MQNARITAIVVLLVGLVFGWFAAEPKGVAGDFLDRFPYKLGLDLVGGSHLVYRADVSEIPEGDVRDATEALRDVIERRVNLFGAVEPRVQTETVSFGLDTPEQRLIVELPGVTDIAEAIATIGLTPLLEFLLLLWPLDGRRRFHCDAPVERTRLLASHSCPQQSIAACLAVGRELN